MTGLLENKIAVVTGGGRGIGQGIAMEFARQGAAVAVLDRDGDGARSVARGIKTLGVRAMAVELDVMNLRAVENAVAMVWETLGPIDIWVNNAGVSQNVSIDDMTETDWDRILNVNLKSVVFCSRSVIRRMRDRKSGKIVNIASLAGQRGGLFAGVNYSAAKGGVITATKCFALYGAAHNVQVNAIAPGLIRTRISEELGFANSTDSIPMGRLGTPEDVARVAVFLASELSDYVTGQTISVNGGMYMS